jgi:hypothetical protein
MAFTISSSPSSNSHRSGWSSSPVDSAWTSTGCTPLPDGSEDMTDVKSLYKSGADNSLKPRSDEICAELNLPDSVIL